MLACVRRLHDVAKANPYLRTEHAATTDYGSYKHTIFSHRLPELTAEQSPLLVALHARLNLPSSYSLSTLSQALNFIRNEGLANNFGLATLGKSLLSYYVSEYLLVRYPRLPMLVHNEAINAYMGVEALSQIGKSWGIEVDTTSKLDKELAQEPEFLKYGKLRYQPERVKQQYRERGVVELDQREVKSIHNNSFVSRETEAYASAVKAIVGGLYTHTNEDTTKQFIHNHLLSRKLPLQEMFQFSYPTRELARLCEKLKFTEPLEIRLIAETGRLSNHAIFVAGAFSGTEKLGEGAGASLQEAKTRAVVNALMAYYLYTPINENAEDVKLPSDENYKFEGIVGEGDVAI